MDKVKIHKSICDKCNTTYAEKNHDYGDSFGNARKEIPNYTLGRLYDKFSRYKTLALGAEQRVKDEAIEDTLLDLANYAIMELAEREAEKEWKTEFEKLMESTAIKIYGEEPTTEKTSEVEEVKYDWLSTLELSEIVCQRMPCCNGCILEELCQMAEYTDADRKKMIEFLEGEE